MRDILYERNKKFSHPYLSDNFANNYQGDLKNATESNAYEAEYFDVMTDGQLGDYDDFKGQGGSLDDIDTWARR